MGDTTRDEFGAERRGGFGDFLRGLLSGIPWSERAEETETLLIDAPPCGSLRIDNTNGRTRVIGEQRSDIELQIHKTARAESGEIFIMDESGEFLTAKSVVGLFPPIHAKTDYVLTRP